MKREFVMLSHDYDPGRHPVAGTFLSEKLDGQRALWLPETRGLDIAEVPFANRQRDLREHVCSGLWSRYAKVIHAPDWWLDKLPIIPLDGELWMGRQRFQGLMSIVKELHPGEGWEGVKYKIFDAPTYKDFFTYGQVRNQNYEYLFSGVQLYPDIYPSKSIEVVYYFLKDNYPYLDVHEQEMLPYTTEKAVARLEERMASITAEGGEGVILRNPSSVWTPYRSHAMVKVKPYKDDEAIVEGWHEGKGKHRGRLGSLILNWRGIRFDVGTGFTDEERKNYQVKYKVGTIVTFRYRETSKDGVPKEGRFLRIYPHA
jgi:DNA ligase-1